MTSITESRLPLQGPAPRRSLGLPQSPYYRSAQKDFSVSHLIRGVGLWGAFSVATICVVLIGTVI